MIKDGDWELFDYDFQTGRSVWRLFDGAATHFRTDYPVENLVKQNADAMNESTGQRFGEGKRIASIPLNIFYDQLNEAQSEGDEKFVSRWLNDSDNRAFRTFGGRV